MGFVDPPDVDAAVDVHGNAQGTNPCTDGFEPGKIEGAATRLAGGSRDGVDLHALQGCVGMDARDLRDPGVHFRRQGRDAVPFHPKGMDEGRNPGRGEGDVGNDPFDGMVRAADLLLPGVRAGVELRPDLAVKSAEGGQAVEDRAKGGAYFLGLGDAIIPTILVVSANTSLPAGGYFGVNLPALGAMLGTCLGFLMLMGTRRDRPQAGLPFLNSGVILGFLAGCLAAGISPI